MAFDRPTLSELAARMEADIRTRLNLGPLLRRSNLAILSRVFAGAAHGEHGHLAYISKQIIPSTAEAEFLELHADERGIQRKAAAFATGSTTFTGTDATVIPQGTAVQRPDGTRYKTDALATIATGTALVAVTAEIAALAGNADAATILSLVAPIAGINTATTVDSSALVGGTDKESDADLLARLRALVQAPPNGGSQSDYEIWALEVAGVTRAFTLPGHLGLGTVGIMFTVDDDPGGPIPSAAQVALVQARVDDTTRRDSRPVTAAVTALAPVAVPLAFSIALTPNTAAVQAAVTANLTDLLFRLAKPGGTITVSQVREAISTSVGETSHALTAPAADVTVLAGELTTLGTITFS